MVVQWVRDRRNKRTVLRDSFCPECVLHTKDPPKDIATVSDGASLQVRRQRGGGTCHKYNLCLGVLRRKNCAD